MGGNKPDAAVCIASLQRNVETIEIPTENSFEFNRALQNQYHILEYVFRFLDMAGLQAVESVNSIWKELGRQELQKRISSSWISCSVNPSLCTVATSPGFRYNNKSVCIIAYCWKIIDLNKHIFLQLNHNSDFHRMLFADYVDKEIVPEGADYCTLACRRVFSSNIEKKSESVLYQGIFIPDIPKIKTTLFYCNPQNIDHLPNFANSNEEIKCVLMFTPTYQLKITNIFLTALLKGQNPKAVAVGGGLVSLVSTSAKEILERDNTAEDILCIVFQQVEGCESDFNAYSVVIVSDAPASFESELIKLKEATVLRQHGIIFRFSCLLANYNKTIIIEKHFPNYPLLGFVVDMQIGWDSLNVEEQESDTESEGPSKPKKCKAGVPKSWHNQSLILVLITWGKKL